MFLFRSSFSYSGLQTCTLENDSEIGSAFNANQTREQRVYSGYSLIGNHDYFLKGSKKKDYKQELTFILNWAARKWI